MKLQRMKLPGCRKKVTPFAGVWIEIICCEKKRRFFMSLPSRECGLKLMLSITNIPPVLSLPSRECGLKFAEREFKQRPEKSLPSRECGLKLPEINSFFDCILVTPFAGVWIEISLCTAYTFRTQSLPSRECGLKLLQACNRIKRHLSLPSRECGLKCPHRCSHHKRDCHSLRGSVD